MTCQADYITEIMNECAYPKKWNTDLTNANFFKWAGEKAENIMTFRDKTFKSPNTDVESLETIVPWFENHETSEEHFLNNGK